MCCLFYRSLLMTCILGNVTNASYRPWFFASNASLLRYNWNYPHIRINFSKDNEMMEITHHQLKEEGYWAYKASGCSDMFVNASKTLRSYNRVHALYLLWMQLKKVNVIKAIADYFISVPTYNRFNPWKIWPRRTLVKMIKRSTLRNVSFQKLRQTGFLSSHGHLNNPIANAMRSLKYDSVQFGFNPAGCCPYSYQHPPAFEIWVLASPYLYSRRGVLCKPRYIKGCMYCSEDHKHHCI